MKSLGTEKFWRAYRALPPGIKEAAVIGIPDARKGEQPLAFIVPEEGRILDEKALVQFLREKLADYKVPRRMVPLVALPRNATGKVLKTALREQARALRDLSVEA